MVACMVMMVWMMSHGMSHRPWMGEWRGSRADAERILAERLARGEIDTEEYERRLAVIRRSRETERT
jgi:putative membrane protein